MEDESDIESYCLMILKFIIFYRKAIFQFIWPIISLCVFFIDTDKKIRCLYVSVLMLGYWITDCIPYYVTGMLPVIMMPLLAIQTASEVCKNYLHEINMLFYSAMFFAISVEQSGLHKRIILRSMLCSGCSLRGLNFSMTVITGLLSMWFPNVAVSYMVCPIVMNLLTELEAQGIGSVFKPKSNPEKGEELQVPTNITKAFFLSTGYAVTIGGVGTIVGNVCNLTYKGLFEITFPNGERIVFIEMMFLNFGPMVLTLVLMWLSLQILLMGLFRKNADSFEVQKSHEKKNEIKEVVAKQLKELGTISSHEIFVLLIILICIFFWMTRYPELFPGWKSLYPDHIEEEEHFNVSQATHPIVAIILLSAIPIVCVCRKSCNLKKTDRPKRISPSLLPWDIFQRKMNWGMLFLLGGGFALGQAIMQSGMSEYIVEKMAPLNILPSYATLAIMTFLTILLTEMVPNVVVCNIALILVLPWSVALKLHPIFLTYPITMCCSSTFCSEHGSRTNELTVTNAKLHKFDLLKYGIFTKIVAWLAAIGGFLSLGPICYRDLDTFPDWASETFNKTL